MAKLEGLEKVGNHFVMNKYRAVNSTAPDGKEVVVARVRPPEKQPVCTRCKDAGYLRVDVPFGHPQFGKPVSCSCQIAEQKARHQQTLIHQSGVLGMAQYGDATFQNFGRFVPGVQIAFQKAKKFAVCPTGWLVLTGSQGCGKTHLAVAIAKARIDEQETVMVQTVPDLLDQLRKAFNPKNEDTYSEKFEEMQQVDLLVLDDFGAENSTPWATEKLFQLFNYRYNHDLPMVITSNNIHLDGVDPRIKSRMLQKNFSCLIKMEDARDYRQFGDAEEE